MALPEKPFCDFSITGLRFSPRRPRGIFCTISQRTQFVSTDTAQSLLSTSSPLGDPTPSPPRSCDLSLHIRNTHRHRLTKQRYVNKFWHLDEMQTTANNCKVREGKMGSNPFICSAIKDFRTLRAIVPHLGHTSATPAAILTPN